MKRRRFLRLGLGAATAGMVLNGQKVLATEQQSPFPVYGLPAPGQQTVARWPAINVAAHGNGVAWCPLHQLEGGITPNGLHFVRNHNGVPSLDDGHKLVLHGKVQRALSFKVADLLRYPLRTIKCFIECGGNSNAGWHSLPSQGAVGFVHGLVSCSEWTGVPLATLLDEAGFNAAAGWLVAEGADAFAMQKSLPLKQLYNEGIIALYQNGERLRPENGYPLRLLWPGHEGVANVKWLRRLEVSSKPVMARNETSKYSELQDDGRARQFSWSMGVKSVLLSPSAGMNIPAKGLLQLSGLAWSGHGRIARVEVSTNGGINWQQAYLDGPPQPYCFTRFRHHWQWRGEAAMLQSRAVDEAGNIQPSRQELLKQRGRHGYYHYNAIITWQVDSSGEVRHVYPPGEQRGATDNGNDIDAGWF